MRNFIEDLLDSYGFSETEKDMIKSEAYRKESEALADLEPGEEVQTTCLYFQDAISEFLAKKELYEKDLVKLAADYEKIKKEAKPERVLPYPDLPACHYLNADSSELSRNLDEDREDNADLYRR